MKIAAKPRVVIRACPTYDVERIRRVVREAMEELDISPRGRTLVKPNVVASGELFPHAYTRPEFVEGVVLALRDRDTQKRVTELAVGERCGITIPTRLAYRDAGYYPMFKRTGVKHYHFEECPQVEVRYTHEGRLRDYVFTPEPVAKADFFVNTPKFKSHPWTTVTFAMKSYIGIQDDRHRLIDHDHRLNEKIADLQYIVQPELIAIDAITAGEGRMLTPIPFDLGLVIVGNNSVAFDSVCCSIIGVDPMTVDHIRLAHERGFGPIDLSHIGISGDVTLEEAKARAAGKNEKGEQVRAAFKVGLIRVEKYFEGTHITAYAGPPPESEKTDYCWGGCPGAIEEAIEILRLYDKKCDAKMPRMHVVFGAYEGPIDAKPGEKIVFIGDCATYHGDVGGKLIDVKSLYKARDTKDPHFAKHDDIFAKMVSVTKKMMELKDEPVIRLEGCPVSVAEQVLAIATMAKTKNPYLSPTEAMKFTAAYLGWRGATIAKHVAGTPYQIPGPCSRGQAAPEVSPPPADAEE